MECVLDLGRAEERYREQARRDGERYVLEWWRRHFGPLPSRAVEDPFRVPVSAAGPYARLLLVDFNAVETEEDIQQGRTCGPKGFLSRHANLRYKPTPDEMAIAVQIGRAIDFIILHGDRRQWSHLRKVHGALFTDGVSRLSILGAIEDALAGFVRIRQTDAWMARNGHERRDLGEDPRVGFAERALRSLQGTHRAFRKLTRPRLLEALDSGRPDPKKKGGKGNIDAAYIAATLSVEAGAFTDGQKADETYEAAVQRAKSAYLSAKKRALPEAGDLPSAGVDTADE
jgi:hypothetical protein